MIRVGVDVGGTFTDVAVLDEALGRIEVLKLPSMPDFLGSAVHDGVARIRAGRDVSGFVHGTTIATNALLEGGQPLLHRVVKVQASFADELQHDGRDERLRRALDRETIVRLGPTLRL